MIKIIYKIVITLLYKYKLTARALEGKSIRFGKQEVIRVRCLRLVQSRLRLSRLTWLLLAGFALVKYLFNFRLGDNGWRDIGCNRSHGHIVISTGRLRHVVSSRQISIQRTFIGSLNVLKLLTPNARLVA